MIRWVGKNKFINDNWPINYHTLETNKEGENELILPIWWIGNKWLMFEKIQIKANQM